MSRAFEYTICEQPDVELFRKQCSAFEKRFPNIAKDEILEDVDGSIYQTYHHEKGDFTVNNDCYLGCLYVESDFDLLPYFEEEETKKIR